MKIIGLTGSIAMGKSTVADFFRQAGISVFSADEAVYKLYKSEPTLSLIEYKFPGVFENGKVNRQKLSEILINDNEKLQTLEKIIHPLVQEKEKKFIDTARQQGEKLVVLDIPLLLETKGEKRVDSVVVVSAPLAIQKERAMIRQNMSEKKFAFINGRQMSDEKKRARADFIIDTGKDLENTREQVLFVIKSLLKN
ncbi:dephospho-CoA kinase [Bartonella henselae]|uniref:Dephospho-CoA kinase n=4 Tax=Bartonella TaxID=773 RepID=COAE_BARHE|nr:dephospho-CoA kinase [Bartonella henselae]Q6G5A8.1 RecName: Full=Dephospho-CoA kinase; AltName: Full=Dephosphocoenzyme A kinase [Bartonella henselae str. Houston-1]ATP11663.1 dephospho-CoA kinase [Bartonella henselae]ETS09328.1 dephospho-CoA kinase [Bartonella henselae JK 50]ETS09485.1 dephospho-CoA kinase [Bartonella henselae JK 51]MDM9990745.1 dephospho-CoA kinase [Bartonella henselae]OLL41409.1 dephospho-CoA kinase [Bartonella henselae]